MEDPDRFGAAGPAAASSVSTTSTLSKTRQHHQQAFVWSRVHINPSTSSNASGELITTTVVPPPRSGAASVVVQDKLYVFGGYGGGTGRLDDFFAFDFNTSSWEAVPVLSDEKPGCRENNGVVISETSQSIILFGGYNGRSWLNDLWRFDVVSQRWTCLEETSPDILRVAADDETTAGIGMPHGGLGISSADTRRKRPSCRFGYVSVVHDNKLVLWGGFDGQRWLNDMYVFDFSASTWSEINQQGFLPSVRSCPAWVGDGKYLYIQGGYDGLERKEE